MSISRKAAACLAVASLLLTLFTTTSATGSTPGSTPRSTSASAPATAATAGPAGDRSTPTACNQPVSGSRARCYSEVWTPRTGQQMAPAVDGPPTTALGPAEIQNAYKLPDSGGGQTVAIVDAYGYAAAEQDLAVFRDFYGLPACTTDNGCFRKVDQRGGTDYPADDTGWAEETALDLDAVSSACPHCNILLVEADNNDSANLAAAADLAVTLGAKYVSNSYGVPGEFDGETGLDDLYSHQGVAMVASTGDIGNLTNYPATSPGVTAAGGTTLSQDAGTDRGWTESAWPGAGSGCSPYEARPTYQDRIDTACSNRAIGDLAADADPATGLAVYFSGKDGWEQVGGTSLAAPLLAAMYALAGAPASDRFPVADLYDPANSSAFNDVTTGSNGSCGNVLCTAGPGWDGPTGLGSPNGVGALQSAPHGDIIGRVSDRDSGDPIANAVLTTPEGYQTHTGPDGTFDLSVVPGSYDITVRAFGYAPDSQTVTVAADETARADFALNSVPDVKVSGSVTDASGHGWPMYAEVKVPGTDPVFTDPATGAYTISLPQGSDYDFHVTPVYDGYAPRDLTVGVGTADATQDIGIEIDKAACTAPGYGWHGLDGTFTGWGSGRGGWTVSGGAGSWRFDNPAMRPPPKGGDDQFAVADSSGTKASVQTTLTSPAVDLTGQRSPVVSFDSSYFGASGQSGKVQLSTDNGRSWSTLWQRGPQTTLTPVELPVPRAAGKTSVRVRFQFAGHTGWYWAIDDVFVGTRECVPERGGLAVGTVADADSKDGITGATVTSAADPAASGTGIATPDDPAVADGFYWLFSHRTGNQQLTATADGYASSTAAASVTADGVVRTDFALGRAAAAATPSVASAAATETSDNPWSAGPGATKVRLLTGDQVVLTSAAGGQQSYATIPAPRDGRAATPIPVATQSSAGGATSMEAIPTDAADLVSSGQVDRGVFDVRYLAQHPGAIPLVVRFAAGVDPAAVESRAAALPASSLVRTAGARDAVLSVKPAGAAAFWQALTTPTGDRPIRELRLAAGIESVWLDGHRLGAEAAPSLSVPTYDVTERIEVPDDPNRWCTDTDPLCISLDFAMMVGLTGPGAGQAFYASGITCIGGPPCKAYEEHFQVPAGTYSASGEGYFLQDEAIQEALLLDPEVTVTHDTSFTIDAGTLQLPNITAKDPLLRYYSGATTHRSAPGGSTSGIATSGPVPVWFNPAARTTVGTFHIDEMDLLGQPPVTMQVTGRRGFDLDATYPSLSIAPTDPNSGMVRFLGTANRGLVSAGFGDPADYAGKNVTGKLVLLRERPGNGCYVAKQQIQTAADAGAAGVLLDPTDPTRPGGACPLWMTPDWWRNAGGDGVAPTIPYAAIPSRRARQLADLLATGPVTVSVVGHGQTPYLYQISNFQQGRIPAGLHVALTADDLQTTREDYHADAPGTGFRIWGTWRPDDGLIAGVIFQNWGTPTTMQEYRGPVTPDVVTDDQQLLFGPRGASSEDLLGRYAPRGSSQVVTWGGSPKTPGAPTVDDEILSLYPDHFPPDPLITWCAACRQGNKFYPLVDMVGASPQLVDGPYVFPDFHMYDGDQELTPEVVDGLPIFDLPADRRTYRLTLDALNTHSEWRYTSAEPQTDQTLPGRPCGGVRLGNVAPCHADPLVFVRYAPETAVDNTAPASGRHDITVTAYHQDPGAPRITSLRLWTSVDGGTTWQPTSVKGIGDGAYRGTVSVPALGQTNGFVSLRVQAADAGGNTVIQTVDDAYRLSGKG